MFYIFSTKYSEFTLNPTYSIGTLRPKSRAEPIQQLESPLSILNRWGRTASGGMGILWCLQNGGNKITVWCSGIKWFCAHRDRHGKSLCLNRKESSDSESKRDSANHHFKHDSQYVPWLHMTSIIFRWNTRNHEVREAA